MKKFLLPIVILLAGCSMEKNSLVQQSEFVITTRNEKVVWIKDSDVGRMIYPTWERGVYGPVEVHLVDEYSFNTLLRNGRQ